jgi:hypothetical protein
MKNHSQKTWKAIEKATRILQHLPMKEIIKLREDPSRQKILIDLYHEVLNAQSFAKEKK